MQKQNKIEVRVNSIFTITDWVLGDWSWN